MKYIYPAIFYDEGDGYSVLFPDFTCGTSGTTLQEAHDMAIDFLYCNIEYMLGNNQDLPKPTDMNKIEFSKDFSYKSCFATLVAVDMSEYEKYLEAQGKSVRKNITIPLWLVRRADARHVNYSAVLQEALKEKLSV